LKTDRKDGQFYNKSHGRKPLYILYIKRASDIVVWISNKPTYPWCDMHICTRKISPRYILEA